VDAFPFGAVDAALLFTPSYRQKPMKHYTIDETAEKDWKRLTSNPPTGTIQHPLPVSGLLLTSSFSLLF
jgi:hypothetical protein